MPAAPTPIYAIPGPSLDDIPADLEAAFDPMRDRIEELLAEIASVPIGTQLSYSGTILPAEVGGVEWTWANGALVDRTAYADFFARVGHAYNGGLDPGGNMVRLPDKRGRASRGADTMGGVTGARLTVAANHPNAIGQNGGAERVALAAAEAGVAAHGHADTIAVGLSDDLNHTQTTPFAPGGYVARADASAEGVMSLGGSGISVVWSRNNSGFADRSLSHVHPKLGAVSNHPGAAGAAHENVGPYEVDTVIVRIA